MKRTEQKTGTARLGLNAETLRRLTRPLSDDELKEVGGGKPTLSVIFPTNPPECGCP